MLKYIRHVVASRSFTTSFKAYILSKLEAESTKGYQRPLVEGRLETFGCRGATNVHALANLHRKEFKWLFLDKKMAL
jgi:hypothetical protein